MAELAEVQLEEEQIKQRYELGYRLLAGCIPYQLKKKECNGRTTQSVEILMISSLNGQGLVFPKGGWETNETVEDAACREAAEEAGVKGLIKEELGHWIFTSKRQNRDWNPKGFCKAYMFALEVTQELETWPEQKVRQRQWFTITSAIKKVRHDWMREALKKCKEYLQNIHDFDPQELLKTEHARENCSNSIDPKGTLLVDVVACIVN